MKSVMKQRKDCEKIMKKRLRWCLYILFGIAAAAFGAQDAASPLPLQSVAPVLWQSSMNVFRRFAANPQAMYDFYGKVLGLKQLTTFDVGGSTGVAGFQAGASDWQEGRC